MTRAKVPKLQTRYSCTAIRDVVRRDGFFKMCEAMSTRSGCRIARALCFASLHAAGVEVEDDSESDKE